MLVITLAVLWTLFNATLLVVGITWIVREFLVKRPRRLRWIKTHNGALIGSEEFYKYCNDQGIDPGYYL